MESYLDLYFGLNFGLNKKTVYADWLACAVFSFYPIKDGSNWYAFCNNNPVTFIDPSGMEYLVVSGSEYDGIPFIDSRYKYNFIEPAIKKVRDLKSLNDNEWITWIVSEYGYSEKALKLMNDTAYNLGVGFVRIKSAAELQNKNHAERNNRKMRKVFKYIIIVVLVLYCLPIKLFNFSMFKNDKDDETVLTCNYTATTGPNWKVLTSEGAGNCPELIDVIGSDVPELRLRKPIYEYPRCKFVFKGKFDSEHPMLFRVKEWNILMPVFSLYCLTYGLNIFQYKLKINNGDIEKRNTKLLEYHEQYEKDL